MKTKQKPLLPTEMTYRCSRVLDQEPVELEILDLVCKVNAPHLSCWLSQVSQTATGLNSKCFVFSAVYNVK